MTQRYTDFLQKRTKLTKSRGQGAPDAGRGHPSAESVVCARPPRRQKKSRLFGLLLIGNLCVGLRLRNFVISSACRFRQLPASPRPAALSWLRRRELERS